MNKKTQKSRVHNFFWRIYGAYLESYARKQEGMQSVSDEGGIYFIDRKTGKPMLGRTGEDLHPKRRIRI